MKSKESRILAGGEGPGPSMPWLGAIFKALT